MKQVLFYQNNPCVILREINEDFVEVSLSHKFAESMELRGHCEGCCIGDSDNKIPCTCDDHSWLIEEIQEEENKLICAVERRLLLDSPIEQGVIAKLQDQAKIERDSLDNTKSLHLEWSESLKAKKLGVDIASDELNLINEKINLANSELSRVTEGLDEKVKIHDKIVVEIGEYASPRNKRVTYREYQELMKKSDILDALYAGGVKNWEWFEESLKKTGDGV